MKLRKCKLCGFDIEGSDHFMAHFIKHQALLEHLKGDWIELSTFCYEWFLEDDPSEK